MPENNHEHYKKEHHEHHYSNHDRHSGHGYHRRRGSLRTWVLSILQEAPRNGYEIMNQIEFASQGDWRPSPGSIYPLLDELCKEASLRKREDGRYEITEKGKQEFEWPCGMPTRQPQSVDDIIAEMSSYLSYLEDLKRVDSSKITPNMDKLRGFKDRLTTLVESK
jgi:DNA-binding PadR family transcriptional regulator